MAANSLLSDIQPQMLVTQQVHESETLPPESETKPPVTVTQTPKDLKWQSKLIFIVAMMGPVLIIVLLRVVLTFFPFLSLRFIGK